MTRRKLMHWILAKLEGKEVAPNIKVKIKGGSMDNKHMWLSLEAFDGKKTKGYHIRVDVITSVATSRQRRLLERRIAQYAELLKIYLTGRNIEVGSITPHLGAEGIVGWFYSGQDKNTGERFSSYLDHNSVKRRLLKIKRETTQKWAE